jgi:cysteine desulfurase
MVRVRFIASDGKVTEAEGAPGTALLDVARLMSDCRDLAFSAGSACASGSGRPSHVLRAIGLTDAQAKSSVRLGFGRYTTQNELEDACARINAAAAAQNL